MRVDSCLLPSACIAMKGGGPCCLPHLPNFGPKSFTDLSAGKDAGRPAQDRGCLVLHSMFFCAPRSRSSGNSAKLHVGPSHRRTPVLIIEVGYTTEVNYKHKLTEKQAQHVKLETALKNRGFNVETLPIILGSTGGVFHSNLDNMLASGISREQATIVDDPVKACQRVHASIHHCQKSAGEAGSSLTLASGAPVGTLEVRRVLPWTSLFRARTAFAGLS